MFFRPACSEICIIPRLIIRWCSHQATPRITDSSHSSSSVRLTKFHEFHSLPYPCPSMTLPPHLSDSYPMAASYCTTYNLQRDTSIACGPSEKDNNNDGIVEHGIARHICRIGNANGVVAVKEGRCEGGHGSTK